MKDLEPEKLYATGSALGLGLRVKGYEGKKWVPYKEASKNKRTAM